MDVTQKILNAEAEQKFESIRVVEGDTLKPCKVGFQHPGFSIHQLLFSKNFPSAIYGSDVRLPLRFGKLSSSRDGETVFYERTFLIEIETNNENHRSSLPLSGFGSCLSLHYGTAAEELAKQFVSVLGLELCDILNHWPLFKEVAQIPAAEQ